MVAGATQNEYKFYLVIRFFSFCYFMYIYSGSKSSMKYYKIYDICGKMLNKRSCS